MKSTSVASGILLRYLQGERFKPQPVSLAGDGNADGDEHADGGEMRRVRLTVTADERFPVPNSTGYQVYASLLSALQDADPTVSAGVHDAPFGAIHTSGLLGSFGRCDRDHHKLVVPGREYEITLGVVDPADDDVFQALVEAVVFEGDRLSLTDGELLVQEFESQRCERGELLDEAADYDDPSIAVTFRTPTCIQERGEVTTLVPHRASVFLSLAARWARTLPDESDVPALELDRATVEANVIEKPDPRSFDTHSVLVNRFRDGDGESRPEFRQGFSGECVYEFKGASESVRNAVTTLALFSRYSGVGSAVARGCGHVDVEVSE